MKKFSILVFFFCFQVNYGQGGEYDDVYPSDVIAPVFDGGGMEKFNEYVNKEFDYSKVTKAGKLIAAFTIDEEGILKNIRVLQILDTESAVEIIRVLKKCPKWIPALRGGKPFSVKIKYPMVFTKKQKKESINDQSIAENHSGDNQNSKKSILEEKAVEFKPKFSGGLSIFYKYIADNFRTPQLFSFKGGKILVDFVIDIDGSLTNINVIKDLGFNTKNETIRVLKSCKTKWTPGMQNGKPVRCLYRLPINIPSYSGE